MLPFIRFHPRSDDSAGAASSRPEEDGFLRCWPYRHWQSLAGRERRAGPCRRSRPPGSGLGAASWKAEKRGPLACLEGERIERRGRGRGVRTCFRSRGVETSRVLGNLRRHLRLGRDRSAATELPRNGMDVAQPRGYCLSNSVLFFSPPSTLRCGAPHHPSMLSPLGFILSVCNHDTALNGHPFRAGFFLRASQTTVTLINS